MKCLFQESVYEHLTLSKYLIENSMCKNVCAERDVDNSERVQGAGEQAVLDGEVQGGDLLLLESDRINRSHSLIHSLDVHLSVCLCVVQCIIE